jgi:hypothetical protein
VRHLNKAGARGEVVQGCDAVLPVEDGNSWKLALNSALLVGSGPQRAAGGRHVRRAGERSDEATRLARFCGGRTCAVPGAGAAPRAGHDGALAGAAL